MRGREPREQLLPPQPAEEGDARLGLEPQRVVANHPELRGWEALPEDLERRDRLLWAFHRDESSQEDDGWLGLLRDGGERVRCPSFRHDGDVAPAVVPP